jgi:hypothetical protein
MRLPHFSFEPHHHDSLSGSDCDLPIILITHPLAFSRNSSFHLTSSVQFSDLIIIVSGVFRSDHRSPFQLSFNILLSEDANPELVGMKSSLSQKMMFKMQVGFFFVFLKSL